MNPAEERVAIVNADDQVIDAVARRKMRARGLIHRAAYILVFNAGGELLVQKRTMTKDIYQGYYDIAAGGVVLAGETYDESARRELFEELGINAALTFHFKHFYTDTNNKVWGSVYSCIHDGPVVLQEEEVAGIDYMLPETVLATSKTKPFTPDGLEILARLLQMAE